jgi:TetR/AcrR family transcriptional repressor of lmrAB and yxaGH operons
MTGESRDSMVRGAASLIGQRGVSATSFSDVLAVSGAPRGSIYHHFPEGKRQLAEDAIRWTSQQILGYLDTCPTTTARDVIGSFVELWRQVAVTSSGASGCPVVGVAIDTPAGEMMQEVRAAFRSWTAPIAARLEALGVAPHRARSVAVTVLAGMEGALILCRAEGNSEPLETVAEELMRLLPTTPPDRP